MPPTAPWRVVLVCVALTACAHRPPPRPVDPKPAVLRANAACDRLAAAQLANVPQLTQVDEWKREIRAALAAGKRAKAAQLARLLAAACRQEAGRRSDLANLAGDLHRRRHRLDARGYRTFIALLRTPAYSEAIACGEGLLQGHAERCVTPPAAARPRKGAARAAARRLDRQPPAGAAHTAPDRPAPSASPTAATPTADRGGDDAILWPWVTIGGGAALLVTGAVLGGLAQARYNDLVDTCPRCTQDEIDGGKRMAISADVMFAVGGAAATAGLVWLIVEYRRRKRPKSEKPDLPTINLSATSISISGRF